MRAWIFAAVGALIPAATSGQTGGLNVTVFGGGAAFTSFQQQDVRVIEPAGERQIRRDVRAGTGIGAGAAVEWWASSEWGLRVHASYVPTAFEVHEATADMDAAAAAATRHGRVAVVLYDASMLFRLPVRLGDVVPYVVLGAGAATYRSSAADAPPGAAEAFRSGTHTTPAGVIGVGAIVPVGRRLGFRFEIADHVARTPIAGAAVESEHSEGNRLIVLEAAPENSSEETNVRFVNNVRVSLGFSLALGRGRARQN